MIRDFELKDLDKVNEFLIEFNHKITKEELINNKFLNILIYDNYKGIIVYDYMYDRIEIEYIIVSERYRRLGIATKLLNYIEEKYRDIDNITLEVRESNIEAINFYKKNGFKEVTIRKNYYKDENGILMIKK